MSASIPEGLRVTPSCSSSSQSDLENQKDTHLSEADWKQKYILHLDVTQRVATPHEIDLVKGKIKEISEKINAEALESLLPGQLSGKQILDTLKKVDTLLKKTRVQQEELIIVKIQIENENKHLYACFNIKDQNNIQLIFDRHIDPGHTLGQFKLLRAAFNLSEEGIIEQRFYSKEYVGNFNKLKSILTKIPAFWEEEQCNIAKKNQSIFNELRMAKAKIPGTATVYFISPYLGKGNFIKLGTLSRYYPGGDLQKKFEASPSLTIKESLNILIKVSETLTKIHEAGFSHNDLKPENIVLDEHQNPVIIDFGSTTKDKEKIVTASPEYLPPEIVDRNAIDAFIECNDKLSTLENDLISVASEIVDYKRKEEELDDYLTWGDPVGSLKTDLKGDRESLIGHRDALMEKLFCSEISQDDIQQIQGEIQQIDEKISNFTDQIREVKKQIQFYKSEIATLIKKETDYKDQIKKSQTIMITIVNEIKNNITFKGCVRQKNDVYALGLITAELIPEEERTPGLSAIIEGMLKNDPAERWTSAKVFSYLSQDILF